MYASIHLAFSSNYTGSDLFTEGEAGHPSIYLFSLFGYMSSSDINMLNVSRSVDSH